MPEVFHRTDYAEQMAQQLLRPGPLDEALRSGVFLSGIRRIGKTTFVRQDLIPALQRLGAVTLYFDLWSDRSRSPLSLIQEAVRRAATELEAPGSGLLQQLRRVKGVNFGAAGISLGLQLETLGAAGGLTLADVFVELVKKSEGNVVLVIDEVQQAMATNEGQEFLFALKAARDRVNTDTDLPGRLLIVGTGSHKSLVTDMATRRSQAFAGAHTGSFEPLGRDYVAWFLQRVQEAGVTTPPLEAAIQGFRTMGSRPEELSKAIRQFQDEVAAGRATDAAAAFATICATLASAAAEIEIQTIEEAGDLPKLAFSRIAGGQNRLLFGAETLAAFSKALGRDVTTNEVNTALDKLVAANLVLRRGVGTFEVADPFVRHVWLQHAKLRSSLEAGPDGEGNASVVGASPANQER